MVDSQDNDRNDVSIGGTYENAICLDSSDDDIEVLDPEPSRVTSSSPNQSKVKKRKRSIDLTESDDETSTVKKDEVWDAEPSRVASSSPTQSKAKRSIDLTESDDETSTVKKDRQNCTFHKGGQKFEIPIPLVRTKKVAMKAFHSRQVIERQRPEHLKSTPRLDTSTTNVARMPVQNKKRQSDEEDETNSVYSNRLDTSTTNVARMPVQNKKHQSDEEDETNSVYSNITDRRQLPQLQLPQLPLKTTGLDDQQNLEETTGLDGQQNMEDASDDVQMMEPNVTPLDEDVSRRKRLSRNAKSGLSSLNESILELAASESAENEEDDGDDEDELYGFNVLTRIEHLTSTILCGKTGLPVLKFSCYGGCDDTIYDFVVTVKQSNIPGAGFGAFLTYQGARVLTADRKILGDDLLSIRRYAGDELEADDPRVLTLEPLQAVGTDGIGFSVSLQGSCFGGTSYVRKKLKAVLSGVPRSVKVRLVSSDPQSLYDEEELEGFKPAKYSKRIGHLGIHLDNDYIPTDNIRFSSLDTGCYLDLGRYGPFRKSDRKLELYYDIKTFLFPSIEEWGFGAKEKIFGHRQTIDITDDTDGDPHEDARANIPMYINEVGHANGYKRNVFTAVGGSDNVHYYAKVERPMKKGDTLELLTDYKSTYESVRERKGYGLRNLDSSVKSDADQGAFIQRNWTERQEAEALVSGIKQAATLFYLLEWMDSIRSSLLLKAEAFVEWAHGIASVPEATCAFIKVQQLVALRRLQWLRPLFQRQLHELVHGTLKPKISLPSEVLDQCSQMIQRMCWESCGNFSKVLDNCGNLKDMMGRSIKAAFDIELVEEMCFEIRNGLPKPLDGSMWCGLARKLTCTLSNAVANLSTEQMENRDTMKNLYSFFVQQAVLASKQVREAVFDSSNHQDLQFDAGVPNNIRVSAKDWRRFTGFQSPSQFFSLNPTTPKGYTAAILDFQAYIDAFAVGMEKPVVLAKLRLDCPRKIVMVRLEPMDNHCAQELLGFPRSSEAPGRINDTWYIVWQVVFVVNAFAQKYLARSDYSLEALCAKLGVSAAQAKLAIERGFTEDQDFCKRPPPNRSSSRSRSRGDSSGVSRQQAPKAKISVGPPRRKVTGHLFWEIIWVSLRDELGWHRENGNRPNDFYLCPPGVCRGAGFRPRVDFFDSVPLILDFLEGDPRWKDREEVKKALSLYERARDLREELKRTKKLPKFESKSDEANFLKKKLDK